MTRFLQRLRSTAAFLVGLALLPLGTTASLAAIQSEQAGAASMIQLQARHHALGFRTGGYVASNGRYALRVEFVGGRDVQPRVAGDAGSAAPGASLERVTYTGLWDGIDLTYRASDAGIAESLYEVAPGADPGAIRLRYNAPLRVNADGTLTSSFATGTLTESAPVAWQEIDGKRVDVPVRFALAQAGDGHEIGFAVGDHDPSAALYIDPTLVWNTFLGGPVPNPAT